MSDKLSDLIGEARLLPSSPVLSVSLVRFLLDAKTAAVLLTDSEPLIAEALNKHISNMLKVGSS